MLDHLSYRPLEPIRNFLCSLIFYQKVSSKCSLTPFCCVQRVDCVFSPIFSSSEHSEKDLEQAFSRSNGVFADASCPAVVEKAMLKKGKDMGFLGDLLWLKDYWWVILILLVGVILNAIKALYRLDYKSYLKNKPQLPPHRDNNAEWDDDKD